MNAHAWPGLPEAFPAPPTTPAPAGGGGGGGGGGPVLYGPYTVEYTDIPHDGNTKTLWTPQVGDVLLRLFPDWQSVTQWDHGHLSITHANNQITAAGPGNISQSQAGCLEMDGIAISGDMDSDISGDDTTQFSAAYVFHTADPVQIGLTQTPGTDPTHGHVELYALVARAVAP